MSEICTLVKTVRSSLLCILEEEVAEAPPADEAPAEEAPAEDVVSEFEKRTSDTPPPLILARML